MTDINVLDKDGIVKALERNGLKQIRGEFLQWDEKDNVTGACAIGQIAQNVGWSPGVAAYYIDQILGFTICPSKSDCSFKSKAKFQASSIIYHLNDYHRWTFKSIARWMKTL